MPEKKRESDGPWEVLPAGEMRRKDDLYAENRPVIKLDPKRVPESLRALIPLAEKFGISDDLIREDFFAKTPKRELSKLKKTLAEHDIFWTSGLRVRKLMDLISRMSTLRSARCAWA